MKTKQRIDGYYYLDQQKRVRPAPTIFAWAKYMETKGNVVARTPLAENMFLSTVFLGIDHNYDTGHPVLYESMIFTKGIGGDMCRYSSYKAARRGHAAWLEELADAIR